MRPKLRSVRRGSINMLVVLSLGVLCAFAALAVDVGYIRLVRQQLLSATDMAGVAAVRHLDGTSDGVGEARAAVAELAALNVAAGSVVELDPNPTNGATGDVVIGEWSEGAFTPTTDADRANAIRITAARPSLPAFFSAVAFNRENLGVSVTTTVLRGEQVGAGTVPYYLPIGLPMCAITNRTEQQRQDFLVRFSPSGADTSGWGMIGASANAARVASHLASMAICMQEWNTTGRVSSTCNEGSVSDTLYLSNGAQTASIRSVADAIISHGVPWDSEAWGTLPARASGSDIPAASYGKTLAGPIPVFDGGSSYCSGGGGNWNQTRSISGFVWGAIYDTRSGGAANQKNIWARLDVMSYRPIGDWRGGPDWGITYQNPGRVVE